MLKPDWQNSVITVFLLLIFSLPTQAKALQAGVAHRTHLQSETTPQTGWLGLELEIKDRHYPVIVSIFPDSPASQSALQVGDMLLSADNRILFNLTASSVDQAISNRVGQRICFTSIRNRQPTQACMTVGISP